MASRHPIAVNQVDNDRPGGWHLRSGRTNDQVDRCGDGTGGQQVEKECDKKECDKEANGVLHEKLLPGTRKKVRVRREFTCQHATVQGQ
ncbi:MAG: hypothetical protein AW09_003859 [Candidatus Accumulibacter phosphatis]|uniref:Uncharacterized protein n=1 Tax=Candidatus Accumulibacter phosphatis TaxID=327160 RepID=A0A080LTU8_9PROT|nr:MAG: hypothetical protein AW09_003859 [Candidatus Accumulibacter phosphatis]